MNELTVKQGDLLAQKAGLIVHGVNMQGKFNSGVAKQIRERYPRVYVDYLRAFNVGDLILGKAIYTTISEHLHVASMVTQEYYGYDGGAYADIEAIEMGFDACCLYAERRGLAIHLPKIGCGRGGLDWDYVEPHLVRVAERYKAVGAITVWEVDEEPK